MTTVSDLPHGCEEYARARNDVAQLAATLAAPAAGDVRNLRKDFRWACTAEALVIARHQAARKLAAALAKGGDAQARAALERADSLAPEVVSLHGERPPRPKAGDQHSQRALHKSSEALAAARIQLAAARAAGVPFGLAWTRTKASAPAGLQATLNATATAWEAAYEGLDWRNLAGPDGLEREVAPFDPDLLSGARA